MPCTICGFEMGVNRFGEATCQECGYCPNAAADAFDFPPDPPAFLSGY